MHGTKQTSKIHSNDYLFVEVFMYSNRCVHGESAYDDHLVLTSFVDCENPSKVMPIF